VKKRIVIAAAFIGAAVVLTIGALSEKTAIAQQRAVPRFEVDARVPQMPEKMMIGGVGGVAADRQGNIWAFNRPHTSGEDNAALNGFTPAPPVIQWDRNGKYLQGWGGYSKTNEYEWFYRGGQHRSKYVECPGCGDAARGNGDRRPGNGEHGIYVDYVVSPDNRWVYVADGSNERVAIMDRATLEVVGSFGRPGSNAGEFYHIHGIAIDP